ncbi:MAG: cytochrome b/b6 domain-containing protein [Geminicoccaceae bacterium]|nr:cytochrome b/b6 domain-containing protein [Geminicoccaceae bacterium]
MAAAATDRAREIRVWDPLVRVLHWSLAIAVALAWATAEESERVHEVMGYAVLAIVAVRLVWGFVGSAHARFADFVRPPGEVLAYARGLLDGTAPRHLGHNPLAGWMILVLLAALLLTAGTGWLAQATAGGLAHAFEEVHEAAANGLLVLIGLHVLGVLAESWREGENLVRAMITGRKRAVSGA